MLYTERMFSSMHDLLMQNQPIYQNNLFDRDLYADQIISILADLSHTIYLNDHGKPVIAIMAEEYYYAKNDVFFKAENIGLDHYSVTQIEQLPSFLFNRTTPHCSNGFSGGLMGFISYDFAASKQITIKNKVQPTCFLAKFNSYIKYTDDGWYFYSSHKDAEKQYKYLIQLQNTALKNQSLEFSLSSPCKARWDVAQYNQAFEQVQEYIKAGDCYQINLTQEFVAKAQGLLLHCAKQFWQLTQAPYEAYLRFGEFELLSCSPELFIDFNEQRKILTKPIKGTMPRYKDSVLDTQSRNILKNSTKDQAENVMIVDLLRNDLSVYAEIGSVKTPKLFNIESFNQVHHMVSEVEATLKPEINPFEMLISALPGGSITGAPKIRAMEIIKELEQAPRGAYCGSMGYFNNDGTGSWNILIRSIQKYQNDVSLWAGGGITIASDCKAEYQECFDKVSAMLNLLNTWYQPEASQDTNK